MGRLRSFSLAVLLGTVACGASIAPVVKVDHNIYKNHGAQDLQVIRDLIVAGLDDTGWGVIDESDGWILAEVRTDDEWAQVRIEYDADHYKITHFDSAPEFKFDGKTIHRRYNSWVEDLDEAIQDQFDPDGDDDDDDDDDSVSEDEETQVAAASAEPEPAEGSEAAAAAEEPAQDGWGDPAAAPEAAAAPPEAPPPPAPPPPG